MATTRFSYIHLSDFHFCLEPVRNNALTLIKRLPRNLLDTRWRQRYDLGLLTLAKPASYVPAIVSGVAQFCFTRGAVSDGIIVTGDLATTGMMSDIGVAHTFISDPAKSGFITDSRSPTLNATKVPIYLIPGNHDKFADWRGSPHCRNFELKFERYMPNFTSGVGHWVRLKNSHYIGFVYADFCLQARLDALDKAVGAYGQGRVYEEILDELKKRTFMLRGKYKDIVFVWFLHFAPFDVGYNLQLIEWANIIEAALALGVLATLCGHTHRASKLVIDKHVVYCGGSSGCIDSEDDSRIHVINLDIDSKCHVSRQNYLWDGVQHEFSEIESD